MNEKTHVVKVVRKGTKNVRVQLDDGMTTLITMEQHNSIADKLPVALEDVPGIDLEKLEFKKPTVRASRAFKKETYAVTIEEQDEPEDRYPQTTWDELAGIEI